MRVSLISGAASAPLQGTIENAAEGQSVSARISPTMMAPTGVLDAGLSTHGQPAAIAGATLWATRFMGKLNGVMKAHGPSGKRRTSPW